MTKSVFDFVAAVERFAPPWMAFQGDPVGLQIGDLSAPVTKLLVSLDPTIAAAKFGADRGCDAWLLHHPLLYSATREIVESSPVNRVAVHCIRNQMAVMGAHTNWDVAPGGINDVLCDLFGIGERQSFGSGVNEAVYKLVTFLPSSSVDALRSKLSAAGAGKIGIYSECSFTSEGVGSFFAPAGASPAVGKQGEFNRVAEVRMEMTVRESSLAEVQTALERHHPYEEPAYDLYVLAQPVVHRAGRFGSLPKPMHGKEFLAHIDEVLGCRCEFWLPDPSKLISTVGFVGGAASGDWHAAVRARCDVLVTGEVRQSDAVGACDSGLGIVAAGHFATEQPGIIKLGELIANELGVPLEKFVPEPGTAGRPL